MRKESKWRIISLPPFFATASVLMIAVHLEPSSSGMGTHHQLGLSPCGFFTETGYPCPMCGMTTSFALYSQLQPLDGFLNQPFSAVLFGGTVFLFCISLQELIRPTGRLVNLWKIGLDHQHRLAWFLLIFMSLGWLVKLYPFL